MAIEIIIRTHVLLRIMSDDKTDVLRLPKRHRPKSGAELTAEEAQALIEAQSVGNAVIASLVVIVVFSVLWVMLTALLGRFFPWLALVLGAILGIAVRRAGESGPSDGRTLPRARPRSPLPPEC